MNAHMREEEADELMIEICGWAGRLPGANTGEEFWDVLKSGTCVISEVPGDRFSKFHYHHPRLKEVGKSYTFAAGIVDDIWGFDPSVFGISPREAEQMDPQQRLLLQVTWEALEDAGVPAGHLAGENVGVYVGASGLDYGNLAMFDIASGNGHFMTGNTLSILANRISYIFDFRGPSFVVDTACSSSLVAMHEAFRALKSGQIDTAIVAGVNLLISPFPFIGFSRATMLSPRGLCRAFDEDALGYVRAEGCVAVVLKRSDVERWPGQQSLADLVAVDVNADGRTVGMSLPSAYDQANLLDRIYKYNGLDPNDLAFVEAHGTGTRVGDPAEAQSIGTVLGQKRNRVLPIGSVKTNIGHLEPASGMAGLVKAALALQNDYLPESLHFDTPNPDIDFDDLNLEVVGKGRPLARTGKRRLAGINSFGFGGTNAHVIIQDPEVRESTKPAVPNNSGDDPIILALSATGEDALRQTARDYSEFFCGEAEIPTGDVAAAAFHRRQQFRERLVIAANDQLELSEKLAKFADGEQPQGSHYATADKMDGKTAFVYSGNGSQWAGMGREAYRQNETFKSVFDEIAEAFHHLGGPGLVDILFADDVGDQLELTSVSQPLIFAIQVSVTRALADYGVKPDIVFGHSIGEAAAAHAAGHLTLSDAVKLIYHRSNSQELVAGQGTMAAVLSNVEKTRELIELGGYHGVEVAAVNSEKSLTISGPYEEVEAFSKQARVHHVPVKKMNLNYPFHNSLIEAVEEPFKSAMVELDSRPGDLTMISTVTGDVVDDLPLDRDYWWRNLREPVEFSGALDKSIELGATAFIEIGPKQILQSYIKQGIAKADTNAVMMPSLVDKGASEFDPIMEIAISALSKGVPFDGTHLLGDNPDLAIDLPKYSWNNKPFRFEETSSSLRQSIEAVENRLLGWRSNGHTTSWVNHIDPLVLPFLSDHRVSGQIIFPGAGFVEMMLAAGRIHFGEIGLELVDLDIISPLRLSEEKLSEVKTELQPETGTVEIMSRVKDEDDGWLLHAKGRVFKAVNSGVLPNPQSSGPHDIIAPGSKLYERAQQFGLDYGPAFQRAELVTKLGPNEMRVKLNPLVDQEGEGGRFGIHPAELDGCFAGLLTLYDLLEDEGNINAFVPIFFAKIQQYKTQSSPEFVDIRIRSYSQHSIHADFNIFDGSNDLIMVMEGARFRSTTFDLLSDEADRVYHMKTRAVAPLVRSLDKKFTLGSYPIDDLIVGLDKPVGGGKDTEERESILLLQAAAQRAAYDVVFNQCNESGEGFIFEANETTSQYLLYAVDLLVRSGDATITSDDRYIVSEETSLPEFDVLINTILDESPDEVAAVTLLSHARRFAIDAQTEDDDIKLTGALVDHFYFSSPEASLRFSVLADLLKPMLLEWPSNKPLKVLEVGGNGSALAGVLKKLVSRQIWDLSIFEPDTSFAARASVNVPEDLPVKFLSLEDVEDESFGVAQFDLIVSSGRMFSLSERSDLLSRICECLSENGRLLCVEKSDDTVANTIFGNGTGWFNSLAGGEFPVGPIKSASEWQRLLRAFDLQDVETRDRTIDGVPVVLLSAVGNGATENGRESGGQNVSQTDPVKYKWLILSGTSSDEHAFGQAILNSLGARGDHADLLVHGPAKSDATKPAFWTDNTDLKTIGDQGPVRLVHLLGANSKGIDSVDIVTNRGLSTIEFLKAMEGQECEVFFLDQSSGFSPSDSYVIDSLASSIAAFSRVALNETPNLKIRTFLLEGVKQDDAVDIILSHEPSEEAYLEVLHTGENTRVPRVAKGFPDYQTVASDACTLGFDRAGNLDFLNWRPKDRTQLDGNEVEVEVAASGMNFRDVMWALGMLPEEALEEGYGGAALGLECSGIVKNVGRKVKSVQPGERVVAFTSQGFASHVVVPDYAIAKVNDDVDLVGAATMPVAFLTAYYSLVTLANLRKDQWVLVHGGAGGVGLAAMQVAKWVGAKVIATAGSPEKRELLSLLGADYVLNSRSLEFAEEVKTITSGGTHVVLNSLAGEAMERGINTLRPFGRFVELGKRDYYGNTKIGLRPFRRNISYFGVDVDQLLSHEPELAQEVIGELFGLIREGVFVPLPYRLFDGEDASEAFRLMQRSGHIGKILLKPADPGFAERPLNNKPLQFAADGAHLVIGGMGGFGCEIAEWLADYGAKTIVLTSRSGQQQQVHKDLVNRLSRRDVSVRMVACDVTDRNAMDKLIISIREEMPLKSVIHSAMVLDDGLMNDLDRERFEKVITPKVVGARYLDQLTWQDELDHFILFSSATTLIGNPGQSHYVAANAYLEGLARERRRAGRPAVAVGWGAIGDVGFLARNMDVSDKLSRHLGAAMIKAREGLDLLTKAIVHDDGAVDNAVLYIGNFDWASAKQTLPLLSTSIFEDIQFDVETSGDETQQVDLKMLVAGKSEKDAQKAVSDLVVSELSTILRLPVEDIGLQRPLPELGMDSLMGLELRMTVQKKFGVEMPLNAISGDTTVDVITATLLKSVISTADTAPDLIDQSAADLASQHLGVDHKDEDFVAAQKVVIEKLENTGQN